MLQQVEAVVPTDRRGRPVLSGIHDARLCRFSVDFGRTLSFETLGADDERRAFLLDGLHLLNVEGLWEGVIVDSISIWTVARDRDGRLDDDVGRAWRALLAGRVDPGGEAAEIERLRRRHDRLSLVSVSCSYGGGVHALCQDVLIDGRRAISE